ncbi:MAG: hypothetical protein KIT34_07325 [Cyanobacteria bacterium TGS_CYA1]|nr:hypothetical protein [Cyanobacteria bacterium TGS_CYA1]
MKASANKFALAFCFVMANCILSDQTASAQLGQSDWVSGGGSSSGGGLQSQQAQMDNSFYAPRQSSPDRSQGSSMNALQAQMGGLGQSNWINGGGQPQVQSQPQSNEASWYQPAGTGGDDQSDLAGSVQMEQPQQQQFNQQFAQQQQQFQQQAPQQQFRPQQYPAPQQQQFAMQQMQQQMPMQQMPMQQMPMQQMPAQMGSSDWQTGGNAGLAFAQQGSDSTPDGIDPKALAQMQNAAKAMGSGKQISGQAQQFLNSGAPQQQMQAGVQQSARFRGGFAVPQKAVRMPAQGGMGAMGNSMGGLSTTVNRALNRSVQSAIYKGVNQGLFRGLSKMRF